MSGSPSLKTSPMMEQWHKCKSSSHGALLLFQLGDFYEAFYEDAHILANTLDLTLTQRQTIPMSGIPCGALEGHLEKLIARGFLVAIADQVEDPRDVKGIVKREITRIVSPATHLGTSFHKTKSNNFFASIYHLNATFGLCFLDIGTSELFVLEVETLKEVFDELSRRAPSEILSSERFYNAQKEAIEELKSRLCFRLTLKEEWHFDHKTSYGSLTRHFGVQSLDGFGLKGMVSAINATGALFSYLAEDLCQNLSHIRAIQKESLSDYLLIDFTTQKHLNLFDTEGPSLLSVIDKTSTPMGSRLMKHLLSHPLLSVNEIQKRQDAIEELLKIAPKLLLLLHEIHDLERYVMRIEREIATPRDLLSLAHSLDQIPVIAKELKKLTSPLFQEMTSFTDFFSPLCHKIKTVLVETPPLKINEGGIFRKGHTKELDDLKNLKENGNLWLSRYQTELRDSLDIKTLKVSYTKAFGYYIEVSRGQSAKMPSSFERRQTLVNAERFLSPELKDFEYKILHAEEALISLEEELFIKLRKEVLCDAPQILKCAKEIALLDLLASLALVADGHKYVKPILDNGCGMTIREGRHPIIEATLERKTFISNSTELGFDHSLLLITGPNMAGKSTYIRQVALIVILAQMGSFVPAKEAKIGIVDKIFSRIGASDDLSRGQSTFMVEMSETANILNNATSKSLVILDEIGRGTSTYDGIAIASAVAEHLLKQIKAKTLFATHYAELTLLEKEYPQAKNMRVAVQENEDGIVFLHKILEGGADKSYGIHVAKLAGLPKCVVDRARELLVDLEEKKPQKKKPFTAKNAQFLLFSDLDSPEKEITNELASIDINRLTPLEALELIAKWKHGS